MDIVCKREEEFIVAVVVLHGNFCWGSIIVIFSLKIDNIGVNDIKRAFFMDILNEAWHTALIAEVFGLYIIAVTFIGKLYINSCIKESLFTQASSKSFIVIYFGFGENKRVGFESDGSACIGSFTDNCKFWNGFSTFKTLLINSFAVADFNLCPFGEGIDNRSTHAMQTARNFISASTEFTACMEDSKNDCNGRNAEFWLNAYGNSTPVVFYTDNIAFEYGNLDFWAVSGKSLINGVVNNFIYKMVKTSGTCRAYIHTGAFSDSFKTFKNLYFICIIILSCLGNIVYCIHFSTLSQKYVENFIYFRFYFHLHSSRKVFGYLKFPLGEFHQ